MTDKQENFVRAFSTNTGGIRRTCACGVTFYSFHHSDRGNFEPGELEELKKDRKAKAFDHTICTISFGPGEYVEVCECWHEKAAKLMKWLDDNAREVCRYYTLEKERLTRLAEKAPTADPPS